MGRHFTFFLSIFLLVISESTKAQQLPDSLLTVDEPIMLMPDSTQPVVTTVSEDSIFAPYPGWPWPEIGSYDDGCPWPGIYTLTVTELPSCYVTWILFDSTLFIPHADSFLGAKANTVNANKIPDVAQASSFAENLCRFTAKKDVE